MQNETNGTGRVYGARAIENLHIPTPKEGGFVVLRGANELGKSSAQAVIDDVLSGGKAGAELARHVDEQGNSHVGGADLFGVQLRIGQNVTRKGSLFGFVGLDGLDITRAIDPRISDPEAADAERFRIWLDLQGVKADPELFAPVFGGMDEMKKVASREALYAPTIPKIVSTLKRDAERLALSAGDELKKIEADIEAANREVAECGVSLAAQCDESVLAADVAAAFESLNRLRGRFEQVANTRKLIAEAEAQVESLVARPVRSEADVVAELESARAHETECAGAVGKATADVTAAQAARTEALRVVDEAIEAAKRAKLDAERLHDEAVRASQAAKTSAENAAVLAAAATKSASERVDTARKHTEDVRAARAVVNDAATRVAEEKNLLPSDEQLAAAQAVVDAASKAKDTGVLVRKARAAKLRADELQHAADAKRDEIEKRREQAASLWPAAFAIVAPILPAGLFVLDGRLKRREEGGRELFFSELSMGARTDIVVRAAAAALDRKADAIAKRNGGVKPTGVLVIDQQFAEALDRPHQERLDAVARECKVIVYGAVCDEGELRAVEFATEPQSFEQSTARGLTPREEQALRDLYAQPSTNGNGAHAEPAS